MLHTLGEMEHFIYQYDDADGFGATTEARARGLMAECETDWEALRHIFLVNPSAFTGDHRIIVQVLRIQDVGTLGTNNGWGNPTVITLNALIAQPDNQATREIMQASFVAEATEICEDIGNGSLAQHGFWNRSASPGEALSRVMSALIRPQGYYAIPGLMVESGLQVSRAGRTEAWMNSNPREDFVGRVVDSDHPGPAVACSILFIYYLYSQLNIPISEIVTAQGGTLEQKFHSLTGRDSGWDEFQSLLAPRYPVGHNVSMPSDNPFPLWPPSQRIVRLESHEVVPRPGPIMQRGEAEVSPGAPCQPSAYQYWLTNDTATLQCRAECQGYAQPVFLWRINGQIASASGTHGTFEAMVVSVMPGVVVPSRTIPVNLLWSQVDMYTWEGHASNLNISSLQNVGDVNIGDVILTIEVAVTERFADSEVKSANTVGTLHTVGVHYEERYYQDQRECHQRLVQFLDNSRLFKRDPLYRIMPDPPPVARTTVLVLLRLLEDIHRLESEDPKLAIEVRRLFEDAFGSDIAHLKPTSRAAQLHEGKQQE